MTNISLSGLRIVPGRCNAPVFVLSTAQNIWDVPSGCCLVLRAARPDVVVVFDRVHAVVCETGGTTSHLAILAREVAVPCFVGVTGVLEACKDMDRPVCIFDFDGESLSLASDKLE